MTISWLKYLQVAFLSKPVANRILYRTITKHRPRSIVELGLGLGERSATMIQLAQRYQDAADFQYSGLDLFEGRDHRAPGMTLKRAHRMLGSLSAKVQLFPGDLCGSLAQKGNLLANADLFVIDMLDSPETLPRLWKPLARLVHDDSLVYVRQRQADTQQVQFVLLENDQLRELADAEPVTLLRAA